MYGFYPSLAESALAEVNVAAGGAENHNDAGQACEADQGESEVRCGEEGPGFHLVVLTEVSIARMRGGGKGG